VTGETRGTGGRKEGRRSGGWLVQLVGSLAGTRKCELGGRDRVHGSTGRKALVSDTCLCVPYGSGEFIVAVSWAYSECFASPSFRRPTRPAARAGRPARLFIADRFRVRAN
jgi:hypothetical protein